MGTRNLTCVVSNGKYKVAQYGQWDGYPGGQGSTVVKFLNDNKGRLAEFKEKVDALEEIDTDGVIAKLATITGRNDGKMIYHSNGVDEAALFNEKFPHLSRDCAAEVLQLIMDGKVKEVQLSTNFAGESLFCEWCYVVDLDTNKFEVYEGFCKEKHEGERFSDFPTDKLDPEYYPVKFVKAFDADNVPSDWIAQVSNQDLEEDDFGYGVAE